MASVLEDWRSAPVNEKMRATLEFLEKLTLTPADVDADDIAPLTVAGVTTKGIEEAIYVCYLFNIIDRLADAFDFYVPSKKGHRMNGHILKTLGYKVASIPG